MTHETLLAPAPLPTAPGEKLLLLDLQVRSAAGDLLAFQLPWDRSASDLEPVLVAGTPGDHPERVVAAFPEGTESVDLLEVPLGQALRHPENPSGHDTLVIRVEAEGAAYEFILSCAELAEPEPHVAYPRARSEHAERQVGAYLASADADWFCDGSSTLECCATTRAAPQALSWVHF
jgi:hypothetical protein